MRERTHGQVGTEPGSGEQEVWRPVRAGRRVGSGPRPVRPAAPSWCARPDVRPDVRPFPARAGAAGWHAAGGDPAGAAAETAVDLAADVAVDLAPDPAPDPAPDLAPGPRACSRGADGAWRAPRAAVAGPRVLARSTPEPRRWNRVRRLTAAFAVALAAAAVVFGLGQLADYTAHARSHTPPAVLDIAP